uniref:Uncharacterized protein n=1 Tax=Physcomitrium patens TaxID=3218 RepID=A0A7I4ASC6_PHYPA|nr:uncharacterized protein LOC112291081 [Physcomitrium patens]|eukprot:XP_024393828.1 uncharacterized protein LOC112291081 [Physcomitrella patens]
MWQGDMHGESRGHTEMEWKLNSGRKLVQRPTPPSDPGDNDIQRVPQRSRKRSAAAQVVDKRRSASHVCWYDGFCGISDSHIDPFLSGVQLCAQNWSRTLQNQSVPLVSRMTPEVWLLPIHLL